MNPASTIIEAPITQITCPTTPRVNLVVKYQAKVMTVSSRKMSHTPRLIRNRPSSPRLRLVPAIQALAPARKMKVGAQKWVIHRVANSATLVWVRSVGSKRTSVKYARTWSSTMMTITRPRTRSTWSSRRGPGSAAGGGAATGDLRGLGRWTG